MFNQIYNCDCLEGMKKIPDGSVDFILSDLPFQMTDCHWDKKIPFEPMWKEFYRVAKKNAAMALFANGKFLIELAASNLKDYRYKIVWLKNLATGFLNAKKMPLKCHEDVLIFYRQLPTYNPQFTQGKPYIHHGNQYRSENYRDGIENWRTSSDGRRFPRDIVKGCQPQVNDTAFHPTQKPVELLEYLIKTYTNEGEVVLDATIGSGSTAVAAINTNRQFIGFELDEKYFEIAQKRISEAQAKREQILLE